MPIRRPGLYLTLALVPVLFSLLSQPLHPGDFFSGGSNITHSSPHRILLLTAHPDDETFFFGPTVTSLIPSSAVPVSTNSNDNASDSVALKTPQVYSLCLSVGNADGLGDIRRRELGDSLDVLGVVKDNRWVLDKSEFQDNINARWDASSIANTVRQYVVDHNISIVLTFDSYGVSNHPNHISLFYGVSRLLAAPPTGIRYPLAAYSLKSKPVVIKYTGIVAPVLIKLKTGLHKALDTLVHGMEVNKTVLPFRPVFVSGIEEYRRTAVATLRHRSQRIWFRWLYMAFSQYMWVNEWERIHAEEGVL